MIATLHPNVPRFSMACRSRTTFLSNLFCQNCVRDLGMVAFLQLGWRCQKHPQDEDNDTVLREHEIWRAREVMPMEPVAEPKSMSRSAYSHLCQGVFRPHLRHQPGPMLRRKAVHSALLGRVLNRHAALELFFDRPEDGPRHNGRHAVSDHPK